MLSEALGTWASIMLIYISRALLNHTAGSLQIFWQEVLAALFTSASKKKEKKKRKAFEPFRVDAVYSSFAPRGSIQSSLFICEDTKLVWQRIAAKLSMSPTKTK